MNIEQFAALKVGDKIAGMDNSPGEVVETTDSGVRVVWGRRHDRETRFFFSVQGTAWMHWSKVEPAPEPNPVNCPHGVAMDILCPECETDTCGGCGAQYSVAIGCQACASRDANT